MDWLVPAVLQLAQVGDVAVDDGDVVLLGHQRGRDALADAAGAKQLVIFHHDPSHDDDFMDRVAAAASAQRPGTVVAREGLVLTP